MAWHLTGAKPLSEPMNDGLFHWSIYVSLGLNELNEIFKQIFSMKNGVLIQISLRFIFPPVQLNAKLFIHENAFENIACEMAAILSSGRWVNIKPWIVSLMADFCIKSTRESLPMVINKKVLYLLWLKSWINCKLCFCCVTHWSLDSRFVPSQWETALLCNDVSHWLSSNLESALHIHASKRCHHYFRQWFITCSLPSDFLNQCWLIANMVPKEQTSMKFESNHKKNSSKKMHLKMLSAELVSFYSGLHVLNPG